MTDRTVDGGPDTKGDPEGDPALREYGVVYLKGIAMGAADTVPGVSGGTIALITGIYERLITAIAALDPRLLGALRGIHRARGRAELWETIRRIDLPFLVVLGLGVVTSVVTLSRFMHAAIVSAPATTYAFFFGLIAASAVVLYRELSFEGVPTVAGGVVGLILGFLVAGGSAGSAVVPGLPIVFVVGAVAITAMVLPGVSGAFILILLGQYEYLTGVLTSFVDQLLATVTGGGTDGLFSLAGVVVTFCVGAVIGLLSVAHAIRWALEHYRTATYVFLVSLMVGSLRLPIIEVRESIGTWTPTAVLSVGGAVLIGAGAVLALDHYTADLAEITT